MGGVEEKIGDERLSPWPVPHLGLVLVQAGRGGGLRAGCRGPGQEDAGLLVRSVEVFNRVGQGQGRQIFKVVGRPKRTS